MATVTATPPVRSGNGVIHQDLASLSIPPAAKPTYNTGKGKRMWFTVEGYSTIIRVPFAPQDIQYSGFGMKWSEIPREGMRKPLLVQSTLSLKKISFTLEIASAFRHLTFDALLKDFETLSMTGHRIKIHYGSKFEGLFWRLTEYSFQSTRRHNNTNGITEGKISLTFTEASDPRPPIGPVKGGVKPNTNTTTTSTEAVTSGVSTPATTGGSTNNRQDSNDSDSAGYGTSTPVGSSPQYGTGTTSGNESVGYGTGTAAPGGEAVTAGTETYVVKPGDTLSGIAVKMLRDATKWTLIATLNGIRNPANIAVGTILKVPR